MASSTPTDAEVRTISILGAGRVGTAIARQALTGIVSEGGNDTIRVGDFNRLTVRVVLVERGDLT